MDMISNLDDTQHPDVSPDVFVVAEETMRDMVYSLNHKRARLTRELGRASTMCTLEKVVWELNTQEGMVARAAAAMGAAVRTFGRHNGWDFTEPKTQTAFLQLMEEVEPDEIHLAPGCELASIPQELDDLPPEDVLSFVAKVFEEQRLSGRHAHLEHPKAARSGRPRLSPQCGRSPWSTSTSTATDKAWTRPAIPPRSRHGSRPRNAARATSSTGGTATTTTTIPSCPSASARPSINHPRSLTPSHSLSCLCDQKTGDIYIDLDPEYGTGEASSPADDETAPRAILHACVNVLNYVAKLHRDVGHPHANVLHRMLSDAEATARVLACAKAYKCASRTARAVLTRPRPPSRRKREFGELVYMDVLRIVTGPEPRDVGLFLSITDVATRYVVAGPIRSEDVDEILVTIKEAWCQHFGYPKKLRFDKFHRFNSEAIKDWADVGSVALDPVPRKAHARLGIIERRNQVLCAGCEHYLKDMNLEPNHSNLQEAAANLTLQLNSLGNNPDLRTNLTSGYRNPVTFSFADTDHGEAILRRAAAKLALIEADLGRAPRAGDSAPSASRTRPLLRWANGASTCATLASRHSSRVVGEVPRSS